MLQNLSLVVWVTQHNHTYSEFCGLSLIFGVKIYPLWLGNTITLIWVFNLGFSGPLISFGCFKIYSLWLGNTTIIICVFNLGFSGLSITFGLSYFTLVCWWYTTQFFNLGIYCSRVNPFYLGRRIQYVWVMIKARLGFCENTHLVWVNQLRPK